MTLTDAICTALTHRLNFSLCVAPEILKHHPPLWEPQAALVDGVKEEKPTGVAAIPTLEKDTLLSGVCGHWKMPKALRREDFERTFRMQARAEVSLEDVLARLRAGTEWNTPADMARHFGKPAYWVRSLMWCALREKLVQDYKTWQSWFPKKRQSRSKPSDAGASSGTSQAAQAAPRASKQEKE